MKILIAHNDYGKYSGEEAVVDKMAEIFSSLGHNVAQLRMSTAKARESLAGKIRVFTSGIHSPSGVRAMREALEREKPDVVNVHNIYPFISPAALRECKRAGVPVVMTIHNFRLICPTGLFMRKGAPCELCLERGNEWGCVRYNCEHSFPKSIAYAARGAHARKKSHFLECVDRFACITDFQRQKLIAAGFPAEKIVVIPNPMDEIDYNSSEEIGLGLDKNSTNIQDYVAFCGRLSAEKGIDLIIDVARRYPDIPFRLAGAVADKNIIENVPDNIKLLGYVKGPELANFYRNARFVIMASRCYEGFPMAILEAAKYSKPTIGPNHGGFTEILGDISTADDLLIPPSSIQNSKLLFKPGNADDLALKIRHLWDNPEVARQLGETANRKLRTQYATPVVADKWANLLSTLTTP